MQKNELRPCTVKIGETEERKRCANGKAETNVIKEAEIHKGYFHTWGSEQYVTNGYFVGTVAGQVSSLYGVVEYEDGSVHKVDPECITFTDRQNVTVNINTDEILKAVCSMEHDSERANVC
ncbi:MAG: hypothetical protein K2N15_03580 [Lachnospiraceae bacterium]|nr:hypothetical protein [Lachnospiraceae bacterium]